MAELPYDVIHGQPDWCGQHWVNRQRRPGDEKDWGVVSLYHTHWSVAGEGNTAVVDIGGPTRFAAICTDNPKVGKWCAEGMIRDHGNNYDPPLPIVPATFTRGGDLTVETTWTIQTKDRVIVAR